MLSFLNDIVGLKLDWCEEDSVSCGISCWRY
jgi:hypothetical protein